MKFKFVVLIFLVSFPYPSLAKLNSDTVGLTLGEPVPDYLGKNRHGDKIYASQLKGKVVVISFWASWCGPCRKELPLLEAIQRQVGKESFQVVAINYKESRKAFRKIKQSLKSYQLTITHDAKGFISRKFGVKSLPFMFILNKRRENSTHPSRLW
ncbi:MAG: TlpA disulfide reductase family protein [Enterobacterales bacterium]|nr:TlpA disulfide reductase family protein [Enterobacterales bacterium]